VRESLRRLLPLAGIDANVVGGYWTRTNVPAIDLVGADREPVAHSLSFAGSIKWLDAASFTQADFNELASKAQLIPGFEPSMPLIAVSRTEVTATGAALTLGPEDLLAAWT
jgi:hypothetical protein